MTVRSSSGVRYLIEAAKTDQSVEDIAKGPSENEDILDELAEIIEERREKKKNPYSNGNPYSSSLVSDREFDFHFTSTWSEVQEKASRIRGDGHVRVISASPAYVVGEVRGDTNIYQATLHIEPGSRRVSLWECGCAWAAYSWGRSGRWKKYEGRMCSHALALNNEAQSRGMFGEEVTEDLDKPKWMSDPTIVVQRPGDYKKPNIGPWRLDASLESQAAQISTHPSLREAPAVSIARSLLSEGDSPAEVLRLISAMGATNAPSVLNKIMGAPRGYGSSVKFAERVADWLENRKVVPGWEPNVLTSSDLLRLFGTLNADPGLRSQVQWVLDSGITPEEIRRQAEELRSEKLVQTAQADSEDGCMIALRPPEGVLQRQYSRCG